MIRLAEHQRLTLCTKTHVTYRPRGQLTSVVEEADPDTGETTWIPAVTDQADIESSSTGEKGTIPDINIIDESRLALNIQNMARDKPYLVRLGKGSLAINSDVWASKFLGRTLGEIDLHTIVLSVFYSMVLGPPWGNELRVENG